MGHKILLADDSITIQKVIELTFSDEDFELHTVGNGQKAIDEIRSILPHIVLCDIIMPEKNGYEVCEFIKSSPDLKHIPVLLLTGAFEPFDQERARAAGCDGFLAKPFEPQTLISKVKELLSRAPVAAAPAPAPRPAPIPAPSPAPQPFADMDDRTVIMPQASAGAPAAPVHPAYVAPPAPPPPAPGAGFDDAFAIEAGERELLMEPGDHTVLLGGRETSSGAPAAHAGDDIWGAVEAQVPSGPSGDDDSSTVFMAPPPVAAPPTPAPPYPSQDYEVQYEADDFDATWRMPNEGAPEPPSTYQGFEEFAEPAPRAAAFVPPPPPIPEPPPIAEAPPLEMPPPLTASAPESVSAFEPYDPFVGAAQHAAPSYDVSPFDSDQTLDSAVTGNDETFERAPAGSFDAYGEPEIVAPAETNVAAEPAPEFETHAAQEPFDEIDAPVPSEAHEPAFAAVPSAAAAVAAGGDGAPIAIDDALIDKVVARVVDKLSQKILQEIAWEVVPDLAEGMIQREIDALKAKLSKVPK